MDGYRKIQLELLSEQVIEAALITIFFIIPLLVLPVTYELFEFNKIMVTYALASLLLFFELIKFLSAKKPRVIRPHLLGVGLIFLGVLALSTLTSIDGQVSLFGYYGRFHGGLISYLAYGIIYFSLTQLPASSYLNLVKVSLFSGFLVAFWGVLEHYGIDAAYWAQDVKARVFSTLGHPNWLGAYLAMLIPWSLAFYLLAKKRPWRVIFGGLTLLLYTAFVFTYSRGASLGLVAAIISFLALIGIPILRNNWRRLVLVGTAVGLITLTFASPFTAKIIGAPPARAIGTLSSGDETGNIRLIVWQGTIELFRHNPILGTGPETFGESFYQFRPVEMNYTSEWNYLFNKAHNEYLNSLATTGLLGTLAYVLLFAIFLWNVLKMLRQVNPEKRLFLSAAAGSTVGFMVQNIFGFTVVPLAVLAILNLAALILAKADVAKIRWKRPAFLRTVAPVLILPLLLVLILIFNLWRADTYYTQGLGAFDLGAYEEADKLLTQATHLNPTEPNYLIQLAYVRAFQAGETEGSKTSLTTSSRALADLATSISPLNLSLWRTKAQIMDKLGQIDPQYKALARQAMERSAEIAPTEAEVRLELAQFYEASNENNLALKTYLETIGLKNDLLSPIISVAKIYLEQGDVKQAKIYLERARNLAPNDPDVINLSQKVNL